MTKQFLPSVNQPKNFQITEIKEKIDDFGKISLNLVSFESENSAPETKSIFLKLKISQKCFYTSDRNLVKPKLGRLQKLF
tara:strand:- start:370 stop:609 length:240 start_codon:yes stop_codon:yes gene_type:complete